MTEASSTAVGADPPAGTFEYRLPSLGADMDAGRVVRWCVAVGDEVRRGDVVAVVETEKSDIDIEIWHDGVVEEFLVELGEQIPVGTPIATMRAPDGPGRGEADADADAGIEPVVDPGVVTGGHAAHGAETAPVGRPAEPVAAVSRSPGPERVPASPFARRVAAERGIDLAAVDGSGPGGAVVRADLDTAAAPPAESPAPAGPATTDPMRALIAERMATANRDIPHYYLAHDVDLTRLIAWLGERNDARPIAERVLPAAAFVKAAAMAAARHPELNGFWVDGGFRPGESIDVAMAISLRRGGLVTPKIAAADRCSLDEIMTSLREFVAAARSGNLRASWMTGATITVTNLGDQGADAVHGVVSPPQVALVGVGAVRDRAWVVDGAVQPRPIVTLTLAADHRATDGATGSRYLATMANALGDPDTL